MIASEKSSSLLDDAKLKIVQKVYLFCAIIASLAFVYDFSILYQFYIAKTISRSEIYIYHYTDIVVFSLFILSSFLVKKAPKFFSFLFIIICAVMLWDVEMLNIGVAIPIFFSALMFKSTTSLIVSAWFLIQGGIFLYLWGTKPITWTVIYEEYSVLFGIIIVLEIIAYIVGHEFHRTFHLYEQQNRELASAREQLANKVNYQGRAIETIEKQKDELSIKMTEMRERLEALKEITHKS